MEHSVKSQKLLSGKNTSHTEHFQMILRSDDRRHAGSTNVSSALNSNSLHGSPVNHIRTRESVQHHNQNIVHHHHHQRHHHHVHDHQLLNSSSVHNHLHSHQDQHSHDKSWSNVEHKSQQSKFVAHDVAKKSERRQQAFSDYSSGNESDEEVKTDYTYAGSGSYNSRVTPTRQYFSPNMSRSRLRKFNDSYKSYLSSDESIESDEDKFLKTKSLDKFNLLSASTPSLVSRGVEKNVLVSRSALREESISNTQCDWSVRNSFLNTSASNMAFQGVEKSLKTSHTDIGEHVSFFTDHSSLNILSQTTSFLSMCSSIISHSVYKFICFVTSTDTFVLSRCCGSRSRTMCAAFLLLLLPLLLLLLLSPLLNPSDSTVSYSSYLSTILSSKAAQETALREESGLIVDKLALSDALRFHSQWQDELEKKLHGALESRWQEQMKQMESKWLLEMEQWKETILNRVKEVDVKTVNEEVMQLKSKLEQQLRQENVIKATAQEELRVILERLSQLEEKQKVMETVLLDLENCCKKQGSLPVGVSHAELAVQLSALAQEVRTNLSQLVLLQSSVASSSKQVDDIHFTPKYNSNHTALSLGEIESIVKVALDRYNADKTGLVDYALESAGGSVVSTRCTESYPLGTAQFSLFGVPFWYSANTPRTVIQPQVHPGECWAMRGTQGYLVIQLSAAVRPTAFSLEHIPKELSPTGKIDSAPKEFSVFGLTNEKDTEGQVLGNFVYVDNGEPLQKFNVQNADCGIFSIVELRVHSNHGNPEYTCLYRFRVHGIRQ